MSKSKLVTDQRTNMLNCRDAIASKNICYRRLKIFGQPVSVCLSLESSTDQTRVAKSLLAPRIILPITILCKSLPNETA